MLSAQIRWKSLRLVPLSFIKNRLQYPFKKVPTSVVALKVSSEVNFFRFISSCKFAIIFYLSCVIVLRKKWLADRSVLPLFPPITITCSLPHINNMHHNSLFQVVNLSALATQFMKRSSVFVLSRNRFSRCFPAADHP